MKIVEILSYNDTTTPIDHFDGASVTDIIPSDIYIELCKSTIFRVHKTGNSVALTLPIRLPYGVENRFIHFLKCADGTILAHS